MKRKPHGCLVRRRRRGWVQQEERERRIQARAEKRRTNLRKQSSSSLSAAPPAAPCLARVGMKAMEVAELHWSSRAKKTSELLLGSRPPAAVHKKEGCSCSSPHMDRGRVGLRLLLLWFESSLRGSSSSLFSNPDRVVAAAVSPLCLFLSDEASREKPPIKLSPFPLFWIQAATRRCLPDLTAAL